MRFLCRPMFCYHFGWEWTIKRRDGGPFRGASRVAAGRPRKARENLRQEWSGA